MTSSVTRSQSNRAHLRYGGAGDSFDGVEPTNIQQPCYVIRSILETN